LVFLLIFAIFFLTRIQGNIGSVKNSFVKKYVKGFK